MTDVDYCDGNTCSIRNICQRYTDYLYKIQMKQDVRYAKNGVSKNCVQFDAKRFIGN